MVFEGAPWNSSATALIAAARAHCHLVMLDDFLNSRRSAAGTMDEATNHVLAQVGDLWAVDTLCQGMGDVLACGILEIKQVRHLKESCVLTASACAAPDDQMLLRHGALPGASVADDHGFVTCSGA